MAEEFAKIEELLKPSNHAQHRTAAGRHGRNRLVAAVAEVGA